METLTDETRKARKQHRCNWCGNIIQKGEKYRHSVNVDGGDMWSFKAHLKCDQIFDAFYKKDHPYWDECNAEYFEESAIEYLCLHVCPSCPLWTKTEDYHGECGSPNRWHDCIDKLHESLLKRGEIKEDSK